MADVLSSPEQEALLRSEGIMAKGYGLIPKLVMVDPSLTLTSKAIYAYLCSLAGGGETAFPSRDNITHTLSINKETFYKHFELLKGRWVFSSQSKSESSRFAHNVYRLASQSPNVVDNRHAESDGSQNVLHSRVVSEGIRRAGYGMLPRLVMQSEQLSHKAKAVYAYFCSFAGAGESAFPSRDAILYHLAVSHPTYYKALHELIEQGYIAVKQRQAKGRFAVCDYYLLDIETPCEKNPYTEKPYSIKQDTEKPYTEKSSSEKPYTLKPATIINSPTTISPKNTSSSSNSPSIGPPIDYTDWQCALDDDPAILSATLQRMDRKTIEAYIARDIGLDIIEILDSEETTKKVGYLISLVTEALFYPSLRASGTDHPPEKFRKKLLELTLEEYQFVLDRVGRTKGVRNLKAYYLASLYNAHEDLEAAIDQEVQADLNQ